MNRLIAITSRYVSAEPTGVSDAPVYRSAPVGIAFVGFTGVLALTFFMSVVEVGMDSALSSNTGSQMGMIGTTVFVLAGLAVIYRAITTQTPTLLPIAAVMFGPGALWCWLVVVRSMGPWMLANLLVALLSAVLAAVLLIEGLYRARWLGVFCGLGAVGITLAAALVRNVPEVRSTVSFALLLATAGTACLYGTLVEIESGGRKSFEELLDAKRRIEAEIAETEDILHDLRSGLLSIETAMFSLDDDVYEPLRTETARLRRLTAKGRRNPSPFDMVPGIRNMVKARRSSGVTIDLRAPSSARILGEESEVMAIVDNLLSNAMRHGADPITVTIDENDGEVVVTVADSGKAVDEAEASSFFRRGFTSRSDGDGIGLDRARMLAALHQGSVTYQPGDDGRTSFVLTLPNNDDTDAGSNGKIKGTARRTVDRADNRMVEWSGKS